MRIELPDVGWIGVVIILGILIGGYGFYLLHQWVNVRFSSEGILLSHPVARHRSTFIRWSEIEWFETKWARFLHGKRSHPIVIIFAKGRIFRVNGAVNAGVQQLVAELQMRTQQPPVRARHLNPKPERES